MTKILDMDYDDEHSDFTIACPNCDTTRYVHLWEVEPCPHCLNSGWSMFDGGLSEEEGWE